MWSVTLGVQGENYFDSYIKVLFAFFTILTFALDGTKTMVGKTAGISMN